MPGGVVGYKVTLGGSSGEIGADGVYAKIDDTGSLSARSAIDYYYHPKPLTYRISVPKSGEPVKLERLTSQTMSYYWKALFRIVPTRQGSFKVQSIQGDADIPGAEILYVGAGPPGSDASVSSVAETPGLDAGELSRTRLSLALADAVKSEAANGTVEHPKPVPATLSACESLRAKMPSGVVLCEQQSSEPARVLLKRGARSSISLTLHKKGGEWGGYGLAQDAPQMTGASVVVSASGLVVCVWDTPVPETVKYKAALVDAVTSTYKVYKLTPEPMETQAVQLDTSIILLSGPNPFPDTTLSCASLAKKEKGPNQKATSVPVSCGTSGDPAVVRVTRGAAVYERVALYKQESGSWAGYGADGAVSGVYVLVAPTGHEVTCVWDGSVTTTVAYSAIPSASERSTYALVPTVFDAGQDPVKDPVKLALVSGRNPFPSPSETAGSESTLSPGAIAGIVAAAFVALLLLLVAATALAVRSGKKRRYRGLWSSTLNRNKQTK